MRIQLLCWLLLVVLPCAAAQSYVLGPDDQLVVRALDVSEFLGDPVRIDANGEINLPLVGRVQAGGKTIEQLESEIALALSRLLLEPQVTVSIAEFRSRPVSILGSITRPGVAQLQGPKTLWELISESGGLRNDAGQTIKITRRVERGPLPLEGARVDETGQFISAVIEVESLREMSNPAENIELMEQDVISVSTADVVYVVGHVNRAGGFVANGSISLLEALSLAGGYQKFAKASDARILRVRQGTSERQIIAVNLSKVLKGEAEDIAMRPQDILFVPHDGWKDFGVGLVTAGVAATQGALIYTGIRGY